MAVADDIKVILFDIAPEFETSDTSALARVMRFIGYAITEGCTLEYLDSNQDLYNLAIAYLSAHKLTKRDNGSSSVGNVTKEKEGDREVNYSSVSNTDGNNSLSSTSYGQEYERIMLENRPFFVVI